MRALPSWALPVLSQQVCKQGGRTRAGSRAPRAGTVGCDRPELRTKPQGRLGPFRGPGREAKQEAVGHKPTWSLLACFQVLLGWNSPRGHVIELPRPKQNFTSTPQDPPTLGILSPLPSASRLPEEHQRPLQGPGDNGTEILSEAPGGLAWSLASLGTATGEWAHRCWVSARGGGDGSRGEGAATPKRPPPRIECEVEKTERTPGAREMRQSGLSRVRRAS